MIHSMVKKIKLPPEPIIIESIDDVLLNLLREKGPLTQQQLIKLSGFAKVTVRRHCNKLITEGRVTTKKVVLKYRGYGSIAKLYMLK